MTDKESYEKAKKEGICPSCKEPVDGKFIHCESCLAKMRKLRKKRYWKDVEKSREYARKKGRELHLRALRKVAGSEIPICRCGCDDPRVLEINHKNGDGWRERRKKGFKSQTFCLQIISGERTTDDLEVVCKVCNIAHYCLTKFGLTWKIHHVRRSQSSAFSS